VAAAVFHAGGLGAVSTSKTIVALASAIGAASSAARAAVGASFLSAGLTTPATNALAVARFDVALAVGGTRALLALGFRALQSSAVWLTVIAAAQACTIDASTVAAAILGAGFLGAVLRAPAGLALALAVDARTVLGTRAVLRTPNRSAGVAGEVAATDASSSNALAMAGAGWVDTNLGGAVQAVEARLALADAILAGSGSGT